MAVSKLWPVTVRLATVLDYASNPEKTSKAKSKYNNADYQALRDVVNYVKNGEKTEQELFCEGINCTPAIAREQFVTVKEQFDKTDGIQAYHGYLSFKETDITPELAQHIGMEFANSVWDWNRGCIPFQRGGIQAAEDCGSLQWLHPKRHERDYSVWAFRLYPFGSDTLHPDNAQVL